MCVFDGHLNIEKAEHCVEIFRSLGFYMNFNFGVSSSSENALLAYFKALNFVNLVNKILQKDTDELRRQSRLRRLRRQCLLI